MCSHTLHLNSDKELGRLPLMLPRFNPSPYIVFLIQSIHGRDLVYVVMYDYQRLVGDICRR